MIFIENPDMKNMIGIYSDNKKWLMTVTNIGGKYEWAPTRFVLKNDNFINEKNIIPISKVPEKVLYNLIKISLDLEKIKMIENFKKILE